MSDRPPRIVILTPVYNEAAGLPAYVASVQRVLLDRTDAAYSVLFIEDGSTDGSWECLAEICRLDPRFTALRLSRNFGAHAALAAGLHHADGDAVAILACDLQDPPETVGEFVAHWRRGAQIVFGHRVQRDDGLLRDWLSRGFNQLLARYAMPPGSKFASGSFLLCDRRVVACFRELRESNGITFAMMAWTGFTQAAVPYERQRRASGRSGWNVSRLFAAMYDAFIAYSRLPIRIFLFLSLATMACALVIAAYTVANYFLRLHAQPGWTSLAFILSSLFGLQFFLMSILGEYLHRIHTEVMRRPRYFVSDSLPAAPRHDP